MSVEGHRIKHLEDQTTNRRKWALTSMKLPVVPKDKITILMSRPGNLPRPMMPAAGLTTGMKMGWLARLINMAIRHPNELVLI